MKITKNVFKSQVYRLIVSIHDFSDDKNECSE
jgi:Fe-S-cluster formation regulator IscX/YfhJ